MNLGHYAFPLVLLAALTGSFYTGWTSGKNVVQDAWDSEKQILAIAAEKAISENKLAEQAHRAETETLKRKLRDAQAEYEANITAIHADYAGKLQSSEERAARYREWAESGAAERGSLADHAAQLDLALTEGRALVEELWETVRQRERELRALGEQILSDRRLIGD